MAGRQMMRGVTVQLPEAANKKLSDIQLARMSAEDAMRGANARANALGPNADRELQARLLAERDKFNFKFQQLSQLVHRLNQWLTELRGVTLEPSPPVSVSLKKGQTLSSALEAVRSEVQALRQHLAAVKVSPLPITDQEKLAESYVIQLLNTARPTVAVVRDQLRITWRDSVIASIDDLIPVLAFVAPDALYAALVRSIKQQPVRADAMPAEERMQRVAELETQLERLEQREESLILRAHGDGLDVLRRPDASPAAVLGVVLAKIESKVA
jgi:hypothetical protein